MQLYYTPKSHFARKVRLLLAALNIEVDYIDVGNVAELSIDGFGPNPLMKVPTLIDDNQTVFDSDNIARYIVNKYDNDDQFNVLKLTTEQLNAQVVMNGIMAAEVELILAQRTGLDIIEHQRFIKIKASIMNGLNWLEQHADTFSDKPGYLNFHLVAMWDHLVLYHLVMLNYPKLSSYVELLSKHSYIAKSDPNNHT